MRGNKLLVKARLAEYRDATVIVLFLICLYVSVKVDVIENSYDKNLHLRCVANITNSVRFWWNFNNVTLQENERVLIQTKGQSSDLKIRKAQKLDSGIYECVARYVLSLTFA